MRGNVDPPGECLDGGERGHLEQVRLGCLLLDVVVIGLRLGRVGCDWWWCGGTFGLPGECLEGGERGQLELERRGCLLLEARKTVK